jgi:hypothetical protein
MKWFMFVVFVHISQYGSDNPTDVKFFQMEKQYDSIDECINDQPTQTIKQIKKFDFQYDWKVATCTNSQFTIHMYPDHLNKNSKEGTI